MRRRSPRAGVGSNQYQSRGQGAEHPARSATAGIVGAVERPAGSAWAARNHGWVDPALPGFEFPHRETVAWVSDNPKMLTSADRDAGMVWIAEGATRSFGAGNRARSEGPDPFRTCFERDHDRVLHSTAFRRLAGKTQVHVAPENDMLRTRLTHALEVAQVASSIAMSCGLNVTLAEAIAKAHDCGHTPCGHAGEDAFDGYMPGGFDHAAWGADVALADLNLCSETLDGIRQHSWSKGTPLTPEATVVAFADRIAYLAHDLDDAYRARILDPGDVPAEITEVVGHDQRSMIGTFVSAVRSGVEQTGRVCMPADHADALAALRSFNHERIYNRPVAADQADRSIRMLRSLVDYHTDHPDEIVDDSLLFIPESGTPGAQRAAVTWIAGATDRYAIRLARERLGWTDDRLPAGVV